ncbi:unnamed protein product [Lymnaea stagnalis]|uniref:PABC domain-containing protein n=1 Tax=Lymnaea stagnalis TaxID=6523 RepID=A0AAV2I9J0_LYMST
MEMVNSIHGTFNIQQYIMIKKKETKDSTASPPSTKEVLGVHLHHKVSQAVEEYFRNSKNLMTDGCSPADKVTGMLLERSDNDILKMLQDSRFLMDNIEMALTFLYKESLLSSDSSESGGKLSYEEIGEILFVKVQKLEKDLAPQITGMLLELDIRTLLQLLSADSLLFSAVNKAKTTLASTQPTTYSGSLGFLMKMPFFSLLPLNNYVWTRRDNIMSQNEIERERIGIHVFSEVLKLYQDTDCASKITGMILEMDQSALQEILTNSQSMEAAILKAYSTLKVVKASSS